MNCTILCRVQIKFGLQGGKKIEIHSSTELFSVFIWKFDWSSTCWGGPNRHSFSKPLEIFVYQDFTWGWGPKIPQNIQFLFLFLF